MSDYYGAYRALEEYYKKGKIKTIGVGNFYSDRLAGLCSNFETIPAVNQIECHPFYNRKYDIEVMKKLNVTPMGWVPLTEGGQNIFNNELLKEIVKNHNKSVAQIALRYSVQRGIIVIPESTHKERMKENIDIFDFL